MTVILDIILSKKSAYLEQTAILKLYLKVINHIYSDLYAHIRGEKVLFLQMEHNLQEDVTLFSI